MEDPVLRDLRIYHLEQAEYEKEREELEQETEKLYNKIDIFDVYAYISEREVQRLSDLIKSKLTPKEEYEIIQAMTDWEWDTTH